MQFSEWHKKRFREGAASLFETKNRDIISAHRFLSKIIALEDTDYAFLLLSAIYYFLFFSFPDKKNRPAVLLCDLRKKKGHSHIPKNPYPVFERAFDLGIETSLCDKNGEKAEKLSEADYITLVFTDRHVLNGLILFEKEAEKRFPLPVDKLYKKMYPYFMTADFSFMAEDYIFINRHYLAGYGDNIVEYCGKLNRLLYGASMLFDVKTEYQGCQTVKRTALKRGTKKPLFSVTLGERKSGFIFDFHLTTKTTPIFCRNLNNYSPALVQRLFHEKNCPCSDCREADFKAIYRNRVYSVPFRKKILSLPIENEEGFDDMLRIVSLILSELPDYKKLLEMLSRYKESK